MVELEEAKQQIALAKQQAEAQRQQIEQRRQEAEETKQKLLKEERKIPVPSQQRLRSGLYAGLEGRRRRKIVGEVKEDIKRKKKEIGLFKTSLSKYEEEDIKPFESQIAQREAEVKEYEKHQKAFDIARDVYLGETNPFVLVYHEDKELIQKYYGQFKAGEKAQILAEQPKEVGEMKEVGLTAWYDPSTKITHYVSTASPPSHWSPFCPSSTIPSQKPKISLPFTHFSPPRDLSRTNIVKDFKPLKKVGVESTTSLFRPFQTTGSPIKRTSLLSQKPLRPPTPSKPIYKPKTKVPKTKKTSLFGFKGKDENDFFFGRKKKKKKLKKKSIWGF